MMTHCCYFSPWLDIKGNISRHWSKENGHRPSMWKINFKCQFLTRQKQWDLLRKKLINKIKFTHLLRSKAANRFCTLRHQSSQCFLQFLKQHVQFMQNVTPEFKKLSNMADEKKEMLITNILTIYSILESISKKCNGNFGLNIHIYILKPVINILANIRWYLHFETNHNK